MSENKEHNDLDIISGQAQKYKFYRTPPGQKFLNYVDNKEKYLVNKIRNSESYNQALNQLNGIPTNKISTLTKASIVPYLLNIVANNPLTRIEIDKWKHYYNGTPMEI